MHVTVDTRYCSKILKSDNDEEFGYMIREYVENAP